jgi:hypothetical protein
MLASSTNRSVAHPKQSYNVGKKRVLQADRANSGKVLMSELAGFVVAGDDSEAGDLVGDEHDSDSGSTLGMVGRRFGFALGGMGLGSLSLSLPLLTATNCTVHQHISKWEKG